MSHAALWLRALSLAEITYLGDSLDKLEASIDEPGSTCDGGGGAHARNLHRGGLEPVDADGLLVARRFLEADAHIVARFYHLLGGLGVARLIAVDGAEPRGACDVAKADGEDEPAYEWTRARVELVEDPSDHADHFPA